MAGKFWEKEKTMGEVKTGTGKKYVVSRNERKEQVYISFKEWWETDDGNWAPSKKQGINVPIELMEEMLPMVNDAFIEFYEETGDEFDIGEAALREY